METQFLYLTTTGRNSGLPREIEIWFVEADRSYYILAEKFHEANWVRNIAKESRVSVRVDGRSFEATAQPLDPEQDAAEYKMAQALERKKYGWGEGLPVRITPQSASSKGASPTPTRTPEQAG